MSTPASDPIQAQLVAARRAQILDAAAKVCAKKSFHPTTIKDIAKEAGIADGTIYHYFENKGALLLGIFDHMRIAVARDVDFSALDLSDVRGFLRALSGIIFGLILESIIGDQTLQARWDELPDFLADLILNGLGSDQS